MAFFTLQVENSRLLLFSESIDTAMLLAVAVDDSELVSASNKIGVRIPALDSDDGRTIRVIKRQKTLVVNDSIIS